MHIFPELPKVPSVGLRPVRWRLKPNYTDYIKNRIHNKSLTF